MMVGELVSNGLAPLFARAKDQELFNTRMREFYDTGAAEEMFDFFAETAKEMYGQWDLGVAKAKCPRPSM